MATSGSRDDFLSRGSTQACLSCAGKTPRSRDKLQSWHMVGAMYGDICLSSQVGTGSSSHDLAGMSFSSLTSWDTVAGLKELKGDTWRVTSSGGSADAVDNRICRRLYP